MRPLKATVEQLRRHNRRLVLRAIYSGAAETRAELATVTGLTKPTTSNLIAELLGEGLVSERGPGRSSESGGKRPTLLQFEPDSRQVIGVTVSGNRVLGVLSNLAGLTSALHVRELAPGASALGSGLGPLTDAIAGLMPQLDAPLLCIGVGVPGSVDRNAGHVRSGGQSLAISRELASAFGVPVHLGNQAELSALGQLAYANGVDKSATLVTIMVDETVEIGVCLAAGSIHYGSDLTELVVQPEGESRRLRELLPWRAVTDLARELAQRHESSLLTGRESGFLQFRALAAQGDPAAGELVERLARRMAPLLAWAVATLRPAQVSIGGSLSDLGEPFLELLRRHAQAWLPAEQLADVVLSLAYSDQLGAMGAVALAIQAELELLSP